MAEQRQRSQFKAAQHLLSELGIPAESCQVWLPQTAETAQCQRWLGEAFPWVWGQIDWSKVPGSVCLDWNLGEGAAVVFDQICECHPLGNAIVQVIWFSAHRPILSLELAAVKQAAAAIFAQDWDTWIIDPVAGWCVECYHEGTLCYGRSTAQLGD